MSLLSQIATPSDLKALAPEELDPLASEIRDFLVDNVSRTGGHLGPNLGVVELTIALHRAFDSPRDVLLWDTGHQAYVHKLLTGRHDFGSLKQKGGLSGYPSRSESEHDVIENSHASTALSYADGIAKAFELRGESDRTVVAVVGDGALTGGMAWEALNNLAADNDRPVVIVVNDNGRSYAPTIGGLAHHLATLRTTRGYERFLDWGRSVLDRTPVVGQPLFDTLHGMKKGIKDMVAPQGMFEDLGLKYVGPVDGHDINELEHALRRAKAFRGPVIVHALTRKGMGYAPAENDDADRLHGVGVIDPETGRAIAASGPDMDAACSPRNSSRSATSARTSWRSPPRCVSRWGCGRSPRRSRTGCSMSGIAEQHAVTSAAGLGVWRRPPRRRRVRDVHEPGVRPGAARRRVAQGSRDVRARPRRRHRRRRRSRTTACGTSRCSRRCQGCAWRLRATGISCASCSTRPLQVDDGPTMVRFPKGALPDPIAAVERTGAYDVLRRSGANDVLIVAVGPMALCALDVAERLMDQGIGVTVIDPRWVLPVPRSVAELAADFSLVVTIEDNLRVSGFGASVLEAMQDAEVTTPAHVVGLAAEVPRPRQAGSGARRGRSHRAADRARCR